MDTSQTTFILHYYINYILCLVLFNLFFVMKNQFSWFLLNLLPFSNHQTGGRVFKGGLTGTYCNKMLEPAEIKLEPIDIKQEPFPDRYALSISLEIHLIFK